MLPVREISYCIQLETTEQLVISSVQIETEYGKGAWSGDIYRDVVAFPGDGK